MDIYLLGLQFNSELDNEVSPLSAYLEEGKPLPWRLFSLAGLMALSQVKRSPSITVHVSSHFPKREGFLSIQPGCFVENGNVRKQK